MNKTKTILFAIAVGAVGLTLTAVIFMQILRGDEVLWSDTPTPVETPIGTPGETPGLEESPQIDPPGIIGREDGPELQRGTAMAIEIEARRLMMEFKFQEAEEYIVSEIAGYSIETSKAYEEVLLPLRYALPGLSQFSYLKNTGSEEVIFDISRRLQDPASLLIAGLWVTAQQREQMIVSRDSLNPVFTQITNIGIPERTLRVDMKELPHADAAYIIPVSLDGYKLTALVADVSGWLYLHSISPVDGEEHPFITIRAWQEIREQFNPQEPIPPLGEAAEREEPDEGNQ